MYSIMTYYFILFLHNLSSDRSFYFETNADNVNDKSHHQVLVLFLLAMQIVFLLQDNASFCHLRSLRKLLYFGALNYALKGKLVLFIL